MGATTCRSASASRSTTSPGFWRHGAASRGLGTGVSPGDRAAKPIVALASTIPAAITVAAGLLLAYELSGSLTGSLVAALALAFGTLTWPYAKYGFNAPLTACFATLGVWACARGLRLDSTRTLAVAGCAFGAALLTRHELMLAAAASLAWLGWNGRRRPGNARRLIAASAGPAACALTWCALNLARFHHPLHSGHSPGFSFAGFDGYLLSPSGALAIYSPITLAGVLLVGLVLRRNATAGLLLAVTLVLGGFYCALDDWAGTRSYGPRYLVTLMPMLVAPLAAWWPPASRRARRLAVAAILLSAIVQLPPVLVNFATAGIEAGQPPQTVRKRNWRWAPIVTTTDAAIRKVPPNLCYLAGLCPPPPVERDAARPLADRLAFSLDFVWLYACYLGAIPRLAAVPVLPAVCGLAVFLFRRAHAIAVRADAGHRAGSGA